MGYSTGGFIEGDDFAARTGTDFLVLSGRVEGDEINLEVVVT